MRQKSKPTPPADGVIKGLGRLVQKADGDTSGKPVFRITSEVLDRHRDRVKTGALNVDNYLKNPVLLWNHNDCEPAIGTARVFQEGNEWFMEPNFDGIGERSKEVAAKVAAGTLRTCSIRFRFLKHAYNEEGGLDYDQVELLENSITNIPANPEALRVKKDGQQQKKNDATPPEGEESKALEQGDLDAIQAACKAACDEAMAPVLETLTRIEELLGGAQKTEQEPGEGDDNAEGEGGDDGDMELSAEEEQELKAFFAPARPSKAK
jgi:HK97 family phage prohead protease